MLHVKTELEKLYTVKLTGDDVQILVEALASKNKSSYTQSRYFNLAQDLFDQFNAWR